MSLRHGQVAVYAYICINLLILTLLFSCHTITYIFYISIIKTIIIINNFWTRLCKIS